ncbi:hypothetical protein D3C84_649080 [compost metagenome]
MAVQRLGHLLAGIRAQQFGLRMLVVVDVHVQLVDALARQSGHTFRLHFRQAAHPYLHRSTRRSAQVPLQHLLELPGAGIDGLVQRVQVKLERLGLDDVRRIGGNGELADGHHRLAGRRQPGQFVAVPVIHAQVRQGGSGQPQLVPLGHAGDREEQLRVVGADVLAGFAQRRMFGGMMHGADLRIRKPSDCIQPHRRWKIRGTNGALALQLCQLSLSGQLARYKAAAQALSPA